MLVKSVLLETRLPVWGLRAAVPLVGAFRLLFWLYGVDMFARVSRVFLLHDYYINLLKFKSHF